MRFQFIDEHRDEFPVTLLCEALNVSPSGYYAWRDRPPSAREMANQRLYEQIKVVFEAGKKTYGSPRIHRKLNKKGVACSENRVARIMRLRGLKPKQSKRFKTTTRRNKKHPVAPNLLQRNFETDRPNQKWLVDITYIATGEGWLYLAAALDLHTRRIVGWAMSDRMTTDLTLTALEMALLQLPPDANLIHHSDQGSQYTAQEYQTMLKNHGIRASMNGAGTWYDNAPMESFFGTLKSELVHHRAYQTRNEAKADVFYYIESFYNRHRLHSSLGYLSPDEYEQLFYQRQEATFA